MTNPKQTAAALVALILALLVGYIAGVPATVTVTVEPPAPDAVALPDDATATGLAEAVTP